MKTLISSVHIVFSNDQDNVDNDESVSSNRLYGSAKLKVTFDTCYYAKEAQLLDEVDNGGGKALGDCLVRFIGKALYIQNCRNWSSK